MADQPPRPTPKTRAAERVDARTTAHADRAPTQEEARRAEQLETDPKVAEQRAGDGRPGREPEGRRQDRVARS